jgi:8-oxo-dGTP pyrophosphatase MutT (NUDIX family)
VRLHVPARCPPGQLTVDDEVRCPAVQDERAGGERVDRSLVEPAPPRCRVQALLVEPLIDGVGATIVCVQVAPHLDEPHVVLATALGTRPVPGGQRGRLVEEEQFGEAPRLQKRMAPPTAELEPARDPPLDGERPPDVARGVVQAPAIPVHEAARRIRDQLTQRRDPVPQRHASNLRERHAAAGTLLTVSDIVRAAGGVVRRSRDDGAFEYAIIHRPKYDDWTVPKGKVDPGETEADAAAREVEEETGLRCKFERELGSTSYVDSSGRDKTVRYWLMIPVSGRFNPNKEVDELRWLPLEKALDLLSYDRDRSILKAAAR